MGYDMIIVQERDQAEKDASAAARKHAETIPTPYGLPAGPERVAAAAALRGAWEAYDRANRSCFRLNIWGMSRCCELMDRLGMLTSENAPRFPSPSEYNLDEWPEDPADYEGEERAAAEAADNGRRFLAAVQAVTDYEPQPVRGIPAVKFSTNDGWLVTPAQCEAALAAYEAAPAAVRGAVEAEATWWPRWIAFLSYAKDRGGFCVN